MRCEAIDVNARPHSAGKACTVCGCTDDNACFPACYWVSQDPPLCSACAGTAEDLAEEQSGFFNEQLCPASEMPALHAPIFSDQVSGHCARCKLGFVL